ncbi:response regulator transcription factor [Streptomyces sp. NPDC057011]|uniref:response regulator transcription factor n=1 Tax=unclassified Streptomyces TaxID=2593676 RepID=UPI00362C912A
MRSTIDTPSIPSRTDRLSNSSTAYRVLVVENNIGDMEALTRGLRRNGHTVDNAKTSDEALAQYRNADMVLLDLELPDLDGLEVCRIIRSSCDVPIIAVTARGSELDRVLGFQAGVDDYVVKPYGFRELLARMEAVMRRARPATPAKASFRGISHGPLTIDTGSREVELGGQRIDLTRKEFDLLLLLASQPDSVVPRRQIMHEVWGDSWSRRTVDTHVSSLRSKLGGSAWILTVRGVGFRIGHA